MLAIFLLITLIFIGGLVYNHRSIKKVCAVCASISLAWVLLLILYKSGNYRNSVLLGLLMGQSITGLYYFGVKRLPKPLRIFTLPYFLSLTAVSYLLITDSFRLAIYAFLTGLWVLTWLIFAYRNDPGKSSLSKFVAKCCEDL